MRPSGFLCFNTHRAAGRIKGAKGKQTTKLLKTNSEKK